MSNAKFRNQRINCSNLNSCATAYIPQCGCLNVIIAVRNQERYSGKPLENLGMRLRAGKTLQQFLQNKSRCEDGLASAEEFGERGNVGDRFRRIAPQSQ